MNHKRLEEIDLEIERLQKEKVKIREESVVWIAKLVFTSKPLRLHVEQDCLPALKTMKNPYLDISVSKSSAAHCGYAPSVYIKDVG